MNTEQIMNLLKKYFDTKGFVSHQIESYNFMLQHSLQEIVGEESVIDVQVKPGINYRVEFGQVHVDRPYVIEEDRTVRPIFPNEARLRNISYDAPISIDIKTILTTAGVSETKIIDKYMIGRIPIMLGCNKCNLHKLSTEERVKNGECSEDEGGYFIITGKERVLITQERAAYNMIGVHEQKPQSKYSYIADIRSMSDTTGHSVLLQAKISKENRNICFSLPYIQQEIPVATVFIAMGFKLKDIPSLIGINKHIRKYFKTIYDECETKTQEEALDYIGRYPMHTIAPDKRAAYATQILENEIFPHMGVITHTLERGLFLGTLIKKLLMTATKVSTGQDEKEQQLRPCDDRDNIANKRYEVAGVLVSSLFRSLFKRLVRAITPVVEKRPDIEVALTRFNNISQGFASCFATGKWGVQKNSYVRQGVSQVLSRLTLGSFRSHLRRIVIPIGKEGKNTQIRQLHGSQIFYICLFETPEGHSSGIVKNFCMSCEVTNGVSSVLVREQVERIPNIIKIVDITDIRDVADMTRVYINGNLVGVTNEQENVCILLRMMRDNNHISKEVSIAFDDIDNEIHIASDSGRLIRPLINIEQNTIPDIDLHSTWSEILETGAIKYVDSSELENCVVAMQHDELSRDIPFNYCEIHPSMMMGVCASIIPYPDHSQSPRNCYQSAMGKQALGVYALSNSVRADTVVHMLDNAQMPLTTTKVASFMGFDKLASGQNVIVALACYTGFNQEDSLILNKSAIDRGLFRVTTYRTVAYIEKKKGSAYNETIEFPHADVRKTFYCYDNLGDDGIAMVGAKIKKNDVLIGRTMSFTNKKGETEIKDCSIIAKANEQGTVDRVFTGTTPEGFRFVKIKIRSVRIPEVGDKFASRAAQKGTVGAVYRQEDMPFTENGITPDIIMNPHAIPSRMTINQMIEAWSSILPTFTGIRRDATPFTENSTNVAEKIKVELHEKGLTPHGKHVMYNGFTGERIQAEIYMGPTYYQRLKHMVSDKMHARAHGDCQVLTRQPLEGRSRDGGLRFGEMERDAMLAHGSSAFLNERLLKMSDYYEVNVCDKCHQISKQSCCIFCDSDQITKVQMPYAGKLLFHELQAMCLKIDLMTE